MKKIKILRENCKQKKIKIWTWSLKKIIHKNSDRLGDYSDIDTEKLKKKTQKTIDTVIV